MYNENIWLNQESNPGPMQLKSGALSTELSRPIYCLHSPYLLLITSICTHMATSWNV